MHVIRENTSKRDLWKRKVEQITEDVESLSKSITVLKRRSQRLQQEAMEREELFSRRAAGAAMAAQMDEESQLASSVHRSKSMLEEALETGSSILESMTGNREILKQTQRRLLDVLNTVGLSESLLKLIDRRQRGDARLTYFGMICIVLLLIIQTKYVFTLEDRFISIQGWCIDAAEDISEGAFICEYLGEVITTSEARRRLRVYDETQVGHALLVIREVLSSGSCLRTNIDGTRKGNVARFLNHSCDGGNLRVEIEREAEIMIPRVCFYANVDIHEHEELTFFYVNINAEREDPPLTRMERCFCGSDSCCGFLPNRSQT
eukprot:g3510.t1